MTEQSVNDLSYGHLGRLVYDAEGRRWLTNRQPGQRDVLHVLTPVQLPVPLPSLNASPPPPPDTRSSRALYQHVQQLVRQCPDLQPGAAQLVSFAKAPEDVVVSTLSCKSTQGDLLTFGRAAHIHNEGSRGKIRIAAFPGGAGGEALCLVRAGSERYGWENRKDVELEAPDFSHGETAWWTGNGAPIEQVCFAETIDERSTLLAVRMPSSTLLFRPLYRRRPVPPENVRLGCTYAPSRLDANQILEIPVSVTGAVPHVDVTFNPWYQRQCAVVDRYGKWFVIVIEGQKRKRPTYKAIIGRNGCITDGSVSGDKNVSQAQCDGWARIIWAGDVNTLVVCNRKHMSVVDIREEPERPSYPGLAMARSSDWILDIRRSPKHLEQIFVLTSSQVFWLRIDGSSGLGQSKNFAPGARTLLCWKHFRDTEDSSLHLSVVVENEEIVILLYSRVNTLVTCYKISSSNGEQIMAASLSGPTELRLPGASSCRLQSASLILGLDLESMPPIRGPSRDTDVGGERADDGAHFYNLRLLSKDLTMSRHVVYALSGPMAKIAPPRSMKQQKPQYSATTIEDDFVFEDGMDDADEDSGSRRVPPQSRYDRGRTVSTMVSRGGHEKDHPWTVGNERAYDNICKEQSSKADASQEDGYAKNKIVRLLDDIKTSLAFGFSNIECISGTLSEFVKLVPMLDDVDTASTAFLDLLQHPLPNHSVEGPELSVKPLAPALVLNLSNRDDKTISLSSVYSSIISYALGHLPSDTPNDYRLAKERTARQVAAELCFASTRIGPLVPASSVNSVRDVADVEPQGSKRIDFSLPAEPTRSAKETAGVDLLSLGSSQYGSQDFPSRNLYAPSAPSFTALPTPSATPSLVSGSTFTSTWSDRTTPYDLLRTYVSFSKQPPPPPVNMDMVLSHWHVGVDPSTYDYNTICRNINAADGPGAEGLSAGQRARLQRKAEKHLHRQRRETAAARKAAVMPASQPALLTAAAYRSSPAPVPSILQNSAQALPSQITPMSQVVAGPYGGRSTKRRKVQRMQGF